MILRVSTIRRSIRNRKTNKMKRLLQKIQREHSLIAILLTAFFLILSYKLITQPTPFYDWDESLYIQTGLEMFEHKYFLFPVWQGTIWLDKPPLIPFIYALIAKVFFFTSPEISTRVFTVAIATIVLALVYKLYFKVTKDPYLTTLSVLVTATTPIFFQRSQVVNLDIFVLLGWLGYLLFFDNFLVSLLFLIIAVGSKSLIGFYPLPLLVGFYSYRYFLLKFSRKEYFSTLKKILIHGFILSLWYILMFILFRQEFITQHIIESHFRRVTASIEFHFGERLYYINLIREQMWVFFYLSIVGFFVIVSSFLRREFKLFRSLYLLPWFLFLNLTKTKIFWYIYATIPQFGFLAVAPALIFQKHKKTYLIVLMILSSVLFYRAFFIDKIHAVSYSKPEPYYHLALYAKDRCLHLYVLMDKQTRKSFAELEDLGLLITTTKWWGSHPSMVYYFGGKVIPLYSELELAYSLKKLVKDDCVVIQEEDRGLLRKEKLYELKKFEPYKLLRK